MNWSRATAVACAVAVAGCAMTPTQFDQVKYGLSPTELCQQARYAVNAANHQLLDRVNVEGARRGMTGTDCVRLLAKHDKDVETALTAVAAIALIALAAKGGGGASSQPAA